MKRETRLTPDEVNRLLERMVIAPVEVFWLGAEYNSDEIGLFKKAIWVIAHAWDVDSKKVYAILEKLHLNIMSVEAKPDVEIADVCGEEVLGPREPATVNEVTWGLILTLGQLDRKEEKDVIIELLSYMRDFWNLV